MTDLIPRKNLLSHSRKMLLLATIGALPWGSAIAAEADKSAKPSTTQALDQKGTAKKEDKDAWKIAPNWKLDILAPGNRSRPGTRGRRQEPIPAG